MFQKFGVVWISTKSRRFFVLLYFPDYEYHLYVQKIDEMNKGSILLIKGMFKKFICVEFECMHHLAIVVFFLMIFGSFPLCIGTQTVWLPILPLGIWATFNIYMRCIRHPQIINRLNKDYYYGALSFTRGTKTQRHTIKVQ